METSINIAITPPLWDSPRIGPASCQYTFIKYRSSKRLKTVSLELKEASIFLKEAIWIITTYKVVEFKVTKHWIQSNK